MLPYVILYHSMYMYKPLVLCIPTPSTSMHVLGAYHFFINWADTGVDSLLVHLRFEYSEAIILPRFSCAYT